MRGEKHSFPARFIRRNVQNRSEKAHSAAQQLVPFFNDELRPAARLVSPPSAERPSGRRSRCSISRSEGMRSVPGSGFIVEQQAARLRSEKNVDFSPFQSAPSVRPRCRQTPPRRCIRAVPCMAQVPPENRTQRKKLQLSAGASASRFSVSPAGGPPSAPRRPASKKRPSRNMHLALLQRAPIHAMCRFAFTSASIGTPEKYA